MQFPDSIQETNNLIVTNLEEAKRIQTKLDSGTINSWSRKRARLEARMARLFEHNQALTTHEKTLVDIGRVPFEPPRTPVAERIPVSH